jgi:tetratricopeptide (TPR) repeat protein
MMGRTEEALRMAERFLKESPGPNGPTTPCTGSGRCASTAATIPARRPCLRAAAQGFPGRGVRRQRAVLGGPAAAAQKQFVRATGYFSRFVQRYPASPRVPEALFHEADAQAALGRFPAAILVFEEMIKRHPRSPLVPAAWGRKGDCSFALAASEPDRYPEAARAFRFLLESGDTPAELRWQAEYKLAQTLSRQGDSESALQHCLAVVYGVPRRRPDRSLRRALVRARRAGGRSPAGGP